MAKIFSKKSEAREVRKVEASRASRSPGSSEECEYCGGAGEITTMEPVWAGEPHMADVGTRRCVCTVSEE